MMMRTSPAIALALALLAWPTGAAQLDVNSTAAISGNFGLEVIFDGTTQAAFVVDTTPSNETVYRAEMKLTVPDGFDFENALPQPTPAERQKATHLFFMIKDMDQPPGPNRTHVACFIKKVTQLPVDRLKLWCRLYSPTDPNAASDGFVYRNPAGAGLEHDLPTHISGFPVTVRVEWAQASAPGANDGYFAISKDNNFAPGSFQTRAHDQLANEDKNIDQIELGAVGGVDAGTTGSLYYDDFASFRTLAP